MRDKPESIQSLGSRIMNPHSVDRAKLEHLTDLPNVGKSIAADLRLLYIHNPEQLEGRCPYAMYEQLCQTTESRHDPCIIDVFISITRFMNGDTPRSWWEYTAERKKEYALGPAKYDAAAPRSR
ncbi:helix-hairpin-helix domain-containing protein [Candidatus Propionivibrio aalborgensis]|uniref:helix-hairpin-helix domain-containing protein n=1 Tax=Candidatus Propionivibrio aalborgensis TaxID=1860101 RepID=UPI000B12D6D3|nr:helix-hairpin-helix domain-containing protein [Candidatus Propionivibrio aalborgensis]